MNMFKRNSFRIFVSACLVILLSASPILAASSRPLSQNSGDELAKRLEHIRTAAEKRQAELGIPGMSLAIVKDGKVIYSEGLGYKDFENKVRVTPSTQFAIGSASKAFTGLSVLMLQDKGKVSLDDRPKKYLPYFKINDPDINSRIQVRDLLAHSSGLNRTDLAMITGKLSREELIKVAGIAKPTAGLREKFQYQNIMYAAAGEIVSKASGMAWEKFVPAKILKPLGMNNTTMSVREMKKADDLSFGYSYNFDTKETRRLPTRELEHIAPAGSINSSADDMAKWLLFLTSGGEADGKRLISKEGFDEWTKPQTKITPDGKVSYGFGWFVQDWKGKKLVQHGGNIDGFNSMVAFLPDQKVGFVLLTNVTASSLGGEMIDIVFGGLLEDLPKESAGLTEEELAWTGVYKFPQAGFDVNIEQDEGRLVMKVPGQPTYILEKVEGGRYKLSNAPDGFFITFRKGEAFLEQPQGNFTLPKEGAAPAPEDGDSAKELVGKYESEMQAGNLIEIKEVSGRTSLVVGTQPPYPLKKREDGAFGSPSLPETYSIRSIRSDSGELSGVILVQPNGEFKFKRVGSDGKEPSEALPSADEVGAKMLAALGGEKAWRKLTSRVIKVELDFVHQGVTARGTSYAAAPNKTGSLVELYALGKKIGWIREHFDGDSGGEEYSFSPEEIYTGQRLEDVKFAADFYGYLDLAGKVKSAQVERVEKIGDEETYRMRIEPLTSNAFTLWISKSTFLPVRRQFVVVSSTSQIRLPITESMFDYREVDGVKIPFKTVIVNPQMGDLITLVKDVKHNVEVPDDVFVAN